MKALLIDEESEQPVMKTGEFPTPDPRPNELLVKIEATALNRADLLQKAGKYPVPEGASPILGLEMAGVVAETGSDVSGFEIGDWVFGLLSGGGYAEYCTISQGMAMKIPEALSFEEAAAIPEVFLTAYQAIDWLGELQNGETILIHAGASGVGTAAIQLAKHLFDARIITTAGTDQKNNLCEELGSGLSINYKEKDFADEIESAFGKQSVDVIVDFVGSPYWDNNIKILDLDGRLIYLAMLGGVKVDEINLLPILRKRLTIKGSTLRNRSDDYKMRLTKEFENKALRYFTDGKIKPIIDSIFDWNNVEKAHSKMANNLNAGKIVLTGM
ncbi:NAD(P)H-quinone oxidoreductase [Rhodohalobacter sp. 614A]|uniref:NAD(P)H-quinone oxidoreductase n=1 Tax=Rhodohalobacter sp. 614A TaxID=2908649 RepID=UPI001F2FB9C5|nr:NAD(P)H-quinone oxidoreductase [Rhodohalobacter sp. 614A]